MKTIIKSGIYFGKTYKIVCYNKNVPHPYFILETEIGNKMFFDYEVI